MTRMDMESQLGIISRDKSKGLVRIIRLRDWAYRSPFYFSNPLSHCTRSLYHWQSTKTFPPAGVTLCICLAGDEHLGWHSVRWCLQLPKSLNPKARLRQVKYSWKDWKASQNRVMATLKDYGQRQCREVQSILVSFYVSTYVCLYVSCPRRLIIVLRTFMSHMFLTTFVVLSSLERSCDL